MKILAIDTTGITSSVAIVDDEKTIAEFSTNHKKTHSETLMPMIKILLESVDANLKDMDHIACASGPGSFTGLRIGAATAKGLAFGAKKTIVPVPTLDALAYNIFRSSDIIVPIMDARRNQAYTAFYSWQDNEFKRISEYDALDIEEIVERLKKYNNEITFLGDGVPVYENAIKNSSLDFHFAPAHLNHQRASAVGSLAIKLANEGLSVYVEDFAPFYLRKSQAERELEMRNSIKEKKEL